MEKVFYIYMLMSLNGTLYVGVTSNLEKRMHEHRHGVFPGFTSKYKVTRLVYFEESACAESAILREKEIKAWRREKKLRLIDEQNPAHEDLSACW